MKCARLTGLPLARDVSAVSVGVQRGHGDGVRSVGDQLLQDSRGLLASNLRLFGEDGVEVTSSMFVTVSERDRLKDRLRCREDEISIIMRGPGFSPCSLES